MTSERNLLRLAARMEASSVIRPLRRALSVACLAMPALMPASGWATEVPQPTVLDPTLSVTPVIAGLNQPIGMAFLGSARDFLVLEKASGQVKRVTGGVIAPTPVLDLAVNIASDRGLLAIALHPQFPIEPFVYISWTESLSGADTSDPELVPLLGNRVDRFVWDGTSLVFSNNVFRFRARQRDNVDIPSHPGSGNGGAERGNNDGGAIKFGPDGKLYIFVGDVGRRGWMQNLVNGPFITAPQVDDVFGGPEPDDAHLSGVVVRLNADGTVPADNPFFAAGAGLGGQVGSNVQKVYSYGHRNGFGMDFDPATGYLWATENGDDSYSELNRVVPGMNGGWIQISGPLSRMSDYKRIETLQFGSSLQQRRYPPTRLAYTPALAAARMLMLPGAVYTDPKLSWRYDISPAGAAFVVGNSLGEPHNGTLWIGSGRDSATTGDTGGSLFRIKLTADHLAVDTSADPRLADKVADNLGKLGAVESETLRIGSGFGVTPAIVMGPDGFLYVVSLTKGTLYRISRAPG